MTEWKLFDGKTSYVSSREFHSDRERANHFDDPTHNPRMVKALQYVERAGIAFRSARGVDPAIVDLGCGDGAMVQRIPGSHGYDFTPSMRAGWAEREIQTRTTLVDWTQLQITADIVIMTEVLEHLNEPHRQLAKMQKNRVRWIIASSPAFEHGSYLDPGTGGVIGPSHDACHAWAWDYDGYAMLFQNAGFIVAEHQIVDWSQVLLAVNSERAS